jgi:hypothetical protein
MREEERIEGIRFRIKNESERIGWERRGKISRGGAENTDRAGANARRRKKKKWMGDLFLN